MAVRAVGWYVRATRLDRSHRLVSGPHEHMAAFAELERIRAYYPDAHLQVVQHSSQGPLPMRTPRSAPPGAAEDQLCAMWRAGRLAGEIADAIKWTRNAVVKYAHEQGLEVDRSAPATLDYPLDTVAGRRVAAAAIAAHVQGLGFAVTVEDWDGDPDVDMAVPALRGNIWLAHLKQAPLPIISWHGAAFPLRRELPGCWHEGHSGRKATSEPTTWGALFEAITIGLCAGVDGGAFE